MKRPACADRFVALAVQRGYFLRRLQLLMFGVERVVFLYQVYVCLQQNAIMQFTTKNHI